MAAYQSEALWYLKIQLSVSVFRWPEQVPLPHWNVKPVVFLGHVTEEWCNAFFIKLLLKDGLPAGSYLIIS